MSPGAVEIDFLGLERHPLESSSAKRTAGSSIRDIQKAVSRLNPDLLRSLFASGTTTTTAHQKAPSVAWPFSRPPSPLPEAARQLLPMPSFSQIPVLDPSSRSAVETTSCGLSAPLTIFYNGTVSVFDVSPDMAGMVMRFVEKEKAKSTAAAAESPSVDHIPLARKKSLLMFLEKRRERLTASAPYVVLSASSSNTREDCKAHADIGANKWKQQQKRKERSSPPLPMEGSPMVQ